MAGCPSPFGTSLPLVPSPIVYPCTGTAAHVEENIKVNLTFNEDMDTAYEDQAADFLYVDGLAPLPGQGFYDYSWVTNRVFQLIYSDDRAVSAPAFIRYLNVSHNFKTALGVTVTAFGPMPLTVI